MRPPTPQPAYNRPNATPRRLTIHYPIMRAHAPPRQRGITPLSENDPALSETCQTPIYGLAGRVLLRGSKCIRAQPAGDLPGSNKWRPHCGWSVGSCYVRRQQVDPALPALSETRQTPIYGLAGRVVLRGSKWMRAQPAGGDDLLFMIPRSAGRLPRAALRARLHALRRARCGAAPRGRAAAPRRAARARRAARRTRPRA